MTTAIAPRERTNTLGRTLATIAHLVIVGLIGIAVFTVFASLFSVGLGLVFVLGIGLFILVGLVYVLFAVAWVEYARVDGLYSLGLPAPRLRPRVGPRFGGWLRTIWRQTIDGSMWRGIASFSIASFLGWMTLTLVTSFFSGIALAFAPLYAQGDTRLLGFGVMVPQAWALPVGILAVLVSAAALFGLSALHALLCRVLLVPSREAQLQEEITLSTAQRTSAVRASEVERSRIERDLHDGVQPRLVSVGMTLGLAQQKIDTDPAAAKALLDEAHTSTKAAITELRQLARGIHASVLDDRGLDAALSALAGRSHVPVELDVRLDERCSKTAEAAVYFVVAESLTNAAKHSRATSCRVTIRRRDDQIWARVEDNGVGGARILPGGGLDGITNRVLAAGGTARLDSPAGGPTALEVSVPCAF